MNLYHGNLSVVKISSANLPKSRLVELVTPGKKITGRAGPNPGPGAGPNPGPGAGPNPGPNPGPGNGPPGPP